MPAIRSAIAQQQQLVLKVNVHLVPKRAIVMSVVHILHAKCIRLPHTVIKTVCGNCKTNLLLKFLQNHIFTKMKRITAILLLSLATMAISCQQGEKTGLALSPLPALDGGSQTPGPTIKIKGSLPRMKKELSGVTKIKIPQDIFDQKINLNSLIKDIEYVPLETNSKCIIGRVDKIIAGDDSYFILDQENCFVYRFDKNGNFLNKIGTQGKGPREFVDVWDIAVDKSKKIVSVLDLTGRKLVRYKYDGSFYDKKPMYYLFMQHEYTNGGLILETGKAYNPTAPAIHNHLLAFAKNDFSLVSRAFPFDTESKSDFFTEWPMRKFGNDIYYFKSFSDTIWEIGDQQLKCRYILDFQGKGWPKGAIGKVKTNHEMRKLFQGNWFCNGDFVITDGYVFLFIRGKGHGSALYFSRKTGKIKFGNIGPDQMMGHKILYGNPRWANNTNQFISLVEPYFIHQLKYGLLDNSEGRLSPNVIKMIENVKVEDNPVLLVYSLNNF